MDGIGVTVKNTVFHKVLSNEVFISGPDEFAHNADQTCQTPVCKVCKLRTEVNISAIPLCTSF